MTRRRQTLHESPIEKLRYALSDNGLVIGLALTFLGLAGLLVPMGVWIEREYALPGEQEEGEIVGFGASQGPATGDSLLVVVRTEGGRLQTLPASHAKLVYCHVGGRIRLIRHGAILAVRFPACAPPA